MHLRMLSVRAHMNDFGCFRLMAYTALDKMFTVILSISVTIM